MGNEAGDPPRGVSRRDLFRTGAGAAVAVAGPAAASNAAAQTAPAVDLEALETLTAAQADILEAVCARLIPSDGNGPGAAEARAAHYIDRALTGPLRAFREAYAAGLDGLDAYALEKTGAPFIRLTPDDQDAVLAGIEAGRDASLATGFVPNANGFFNLVRTHTIQGTFCDPYYGGNAGFVGWDLIGYPGLRLAVGPQDQRMKAPDPVRKSAYEDLMFASVGRVRANRKAGDHDH